VEGSGGGLYDVAGEIGTMRREFFTKIGDMARSRGYSQMSESAVEHDIPRRVSTF
jgi:hypothetical protein